MKRIGRYSIGDITLERMFKAAHTRFNEFSHSLSWEIGGFAKQNKHRLNQYQNKHYGQRCFIVANGPSLSRMDLGILNKEYSFGLNRIYLLFSSSSFRPKYYLALNELILEQFSQDISALDMPKFLNWNRRSLFNFEDPTTLFLKSRMVFKDKFIEDISKPIVVGGTVTFVALQLAFFMGFTKVILIGLDHNYQEKGVPSRTVIRENNPDKSHFHPDYFPGGTKWQLPDLFRSELDYQLALTHFKKDGREILDATVDGKCQIFPKVDYSSLFIHEGD